MKKRAYPDRLFVGLYPAGVVYADKRREKHGDYARCAFLSYRTLKLEVESDCPKPLVTVIKRDAAKLQARRGEDLVYTSSGQTVRLGRSARGR